MKWKDFINMLDPFDANEICFIAEVDNCDNIISKVIVGDCRGDGTSTFMFEEKLNITEVEILCGCDYVTFGENDKLITESGRIFRYTST